MNLPEQAVDKTREEAARLLAIIDTFPGRRALVIGDVMLDEYIYGDVDRVSPEAPVPVVALRKREAQPGGAANVALNLRSLGAEVALVGLRGDDDTGERLVETLADAGIEGAGLVVSEARRTTRKTRVMAQGQQLLRVDTEDDAPPSQAEEALLWNRIERLLAAQPEVIVFEDYDKGALSAGLIARIVSRARALHIPTIVDPKLRNFWAYRDVTLFKPNLKEIRAALPGEVIDPERLDSLRAGHEALRARLRQEGSLVTLGALGAFLATGGFQARVPAHRRRIADVCGAGDTVVATSALALASGAAHEDLLALANLAGGLACEYVGVHPIRRGDFVRGLAGWAHGAIAL